MKTSSGHNSGGCFAGFMRLFISDIRTISVYGKRIPDIVGIFGLPLLTVLRVDRQRNVTYSPLTHKQRSANYMTIGRWVL